MASLKLEFEQAESNGREQVTARRSDGYVVATDVFDVASRGARGGFVEFVCQSCPIADRRDLERQFDRHLAERSQGEDAAPVEAQEPRPVRNRYIPFPVSALPEPLRAYVTDASKALGCDPSYVALPMLSALASAIGTTRRIQLKRNWAEPAIIWTAIIGESGTLKTPAFKLAVQPIRDRQNADMQRYGETLSEHETDTLHYEKALSEWRRTKDGDPPEKPHQPEAVRCLVSDTTVEALAPILKANPRGVLLARDELAGWIRSFDQYKAGRGGDVQHWLSMHNGEALVVDRKSQGALHVPVAAVCVAGGVQPGILDRVLGYEHRESGLLARLLLAMPARTTKRWSEAEISAATEASIRELFDRLFDLEHDHDPDGEPCPRLVTLDPEAKAAWVQFYNEHAEEHSNLTGDLSAAWSKLEGYAARVALVVHMIRVTVNRGLDPAVADEHSIGTGVELSRWFGHEAERIYGALGESSEDRDRRQLVELVERRGGSITPRQLMQACRAFRTTAADAEAALDDLVKQGYGQWQHTGSGAKGGRPSKHFVLAGNTDGGNGNETPD